MGLLNVSSVISVRDNGDSVIGVRIASMPIVNSVLLMRAPELKLEMSSLVALFLLQFKEVIRLTLF